MTFDNKVLKKMSCRLNQLASTTTNYNDLRVVGMGGA